MIQKEKLLYEVYKEIFDYKNKSIIERKKYLNTLKEKIIDKIKLLLTKDGAKNYPILAEQDTKEIDSYADELVSNIEKNYSRSFFRKWAEKVIRFIIRKKQSQYKENIAEKTNKIGERIAYHIKNDPVNKSNKRNKSLQNANSYLARINKFDLLDKLINIEEIKKLNDQDLDTLYRLSVLDISINGIKPGTPLSIGSIQNKVNEAEKKQKPISREEMLNDIDAVLKDFTEFNEAPIDMGLINRMKYGKAAMLVLDLEKDIAPEYKKDSEFMRVYQEVVDKQDMCFLKEIAFDIASSVKDLGNSTLFKTYEMANAESAHSALTNDLLSQLKEQKEFILKKLDNADSIDDFKDRLIKRLQGKGLSRHVEAVREEIEPEFKSLSSKGKVRNISQSVSVR